MSVFCSAFAMIVLRPFMGVANLPKSAFAMTAFLAFHTVMGVANLSRSAFAMDDCQFA